MRLDKWLWAARFFRSRTLAKEAIDRGHVRYAGERAKVSRAVEPGATLTIRQGWDEIEVVVSALAELRGPAAAARLLYEETAASRERRQTAALQRRASGVDAPDDRPTKKQRRQIQRFKCSLGE